MDLDYAELVEQRSKLYTKLLDYSHKQLAYLEDIEQDAENELPHFLKLQRGWNVCTREISRLDQLLGGLETSENASDEEWRIQILSQIEANVGKFREGLENSTAQTGSSLQSVNNQRKVLNAYYGVQRNDQISLYVDEKK